MERTELVHEAATRFHADDESGLLDCFAGRVEVFTDPGHLRAEIESRDELAAWYREIRRTHVGLSAGLHHLEEHADCVVVDVAIVIGPAEAQEGWRVTLALGFADDRISAVRPFWQREAALRWLGDSS